jgi:hypothetical protein
MFECFPRVLYEMLLYDITLNSSFNNRLAFMSSSLDEVTITKEDKKLIRVFDLTLEEANITDRDLI